MLNKCYICGDSPAIQPLALKKSFTGHTRCKCPESKNLCDRCYNCIEGKYKQCWYHKEDGKTSKLWGRNWSWLISEQESYPKFAPGKDGLLEVSQLPTRELIRQWILEPPEPPFTICLAVSGQKHTYPFSTVARDRSFFPILLEETTIYWNAQEHAPLLGVFETLLRLGFTKTEITSGNYSPTRISKVDIPAFMGLTKELQPHLNTPILDLLNYIAQTPK